MVSTKEIEFYLGYVDKLDRAMIEDKEYDRTTQDYAKELEKDKKIKKE